MNTVNKNNMMMPRMQQQAQPEVTNLNIINSAMAQLPITDGKLNQDEMKNILSSTANDNTNTTNRTVVSTTLHYTK